MTKKPGNQEPLGLRVLRFMREHRLVTGRHCLLVAVSGGPDSVCLLHVLFKLQEELGIRLHVAHLNHQLRGADSEADARYVADLAHRLGIPFTVEQREVKAYQAQQRCSLEEAAREVRYNFLAQIAEAVGATRVAVGHTVDDHVETILMHLIRGTGTKGLRGLQPSVSWQLSSGSLTVIRPLLEVNREETDGYCRQHQLEPRLDASNLSLSPLRNRIRHQLLPILQGYNPGVREALLRMARIAGDDLAFLDRESDRLWGKLVQKEGGTIILDRRGFLKLPPALKRHLLRVSIEKLLGNIKDIETRHIEEIMAILTRPAGKRLNLPGGLIFSVEYDKYLLGSDTAALSPFPILEGEFTLKIPGETQLPDWRVEATVVDPSVVKGMGLINKDFTACFDLDKTGDKLLVRSRQRGDKFQPLGMSQPKKLGEFMIDARIPRSWRPRIPVVCSPEQILWVVGWRIDDRVKVTGGTKRILRLEFKTR